LAPVKRPRSIFVVDELPRVAGGKVNKGLLSALNATLAKVRDVDEELLHLLNVRARFLAAAGSLSPNEVRRGLSRLVALNRGPLHDESVEEIFRRLNELMGF